MKYDNNYWNDVKKVVLNIPQIELLYGKKVLVTGATGMICSSIIDILLFLNKERDAKIKMIVAGRNEDRIKKRFKDILVEEDYCFIRFDATKSQPINAQVDYIIHGASNANPAIYAKEPVETLLGNIVGLNCVLDLAKSNIGSRLLYLSSSEVYGNRSDGLSAPYREEDYGFIDILNPRACYPNSKRAAETLYVSYYKEYGVYTTIARPGHVYGPSITKADNRASAAFTRDVIAGRNIVMKSAGMQLRSYIYTLDCASAVLTILLHGSPANAYNVSNKKSVVSIRDIAETFANVGGVKVVFENPSDIEKNSYNMMSNSSLNADKLEKLGWKAEFDLLQGVKKTIQYLSDEE